MYILHGIESVYSGRCCTVYGKHTGQHLRPVHKYNVVSAEKMKKYKEKYRCV